GELGDADDGRDDRVLCNVRSESESDTIPRSCGNARGLRECPRQDRRAVDGVPLQAPLAPPSLSAATPVQTSARASLEEVLPAIVRRIAWSGDGRKGAVRLEFGAGALSGAA